MTKTRLVLLAVVAATLSPALGAQTTPRRLTIDAIYHPERRVNFSGVEPRVTWIDDETYRIETRDARGAGWFKVTADTGATTRLFDPAQMELAVASIPGVTRTDAGRLARSRDLVFNHAHTAVVGALAEDLYVYDFSSGRATRLTAAPGAEEEATFSPDGRLVAFVRANNLYVVDLESRRERALTSDGSADVLNGKLDWLYQEEIYGRGRFRGYWWSPDSNSIAFLQLNERRVPKYTVVDHLPYRPRLEVTDYPKAGDPNPTVRLGVAAVTAAGLRWANLDDYTREEILIVNVAWTPDSRQLAYQVQDREQTWLDLRLAEATTGHGRRLLRDTTKAWVDPLGNPEWLPDGSFLWLSERTGFKHVYHYGADGMLRRQVTSGRWEVRTLYGVDAPNGYVYFSAPERHAISTDIYRIRLDGTGLMRLSQPDGTHRATFNPAFTRYTDAWSTATTPPQTRLHRADGSEVRVIEANQVPQLAEYRLSAPEFVEIKARDGFVLDAVMIKPPDFDPSRRYPVYQFTYAGPGAAEVRNRWDGSDYMFHQLLAQEGVIVWILDNRSASGKGAESQWPVYQRLGEMELRDLEDGITWLKQQPYVDPSRILISGWSYGGFMAAYALTHSTSWSAGIVGAPVTDWRDYDTVYTERLMRTPQNNAEGYRRTAPRFAAANLHGRMLLIHGTTDDNVHMQNSIQFAYELQRAGKSFEMMLYPTQRHTFDDEHLIAHLRQLMFDFVTRTLLGRV